MSLFSDLVGAYRSQGWTQQEAINIASVQTRGEGSSLGSGGMDASSGGSNGISQWSAARWAQGVSWMNGQGLDTRSVAGQSAWTTQELRTTYKNVDPNSIPDLVNNYESPALGNRAAEISRSQAFANANGGTQGTDAGPGGPLKSLGIGGPDVSKTPGGIGTTSPGGLQNQGSGTQTGIGDTMTGSPVYVTDPNVIALEAGKKVEQGANEAGKQVKEGLGQTAASVDKATAQAGGITQYLGNLFFNILPRIGIITMGIILIAGAFVIMGLEQAKKAA